MEITAELVKALRLKTNAGMMDCKKALKETDGDLDKAVDYLRQKRCEWLSEISASGRGQGSQGQSVIRLPA